MAVVDHADPVGALAAWASTTLIVPPGHPLSGEPMALPDFAASWLRCSWDAHESALSTARKNAKSAIAAVLALGYLVGPLRRPGWRGAIASITKEKASELRRQVAEIAEASGLDVRGSGDRHIRAHRIGDRFTRHAERGSDGGPCGGIRPGDR